MIAICFYAERRTTDPAEARQEMWGTLAEAFDASLLLIIDTTQMGAEFAPIVRVPFEIHGALEDVWAAYPAANYVYADEDQSATLLRSFAHPDEDVIYCFGSDGGGYRSTLPQGATLLRIATNASLWAVQAASIVLAAR